MATLQDPNQDPNAPKNPVNAPTSGTSAPAGAGAATTNQNPVSPVQQNIAPQQNAGYTDVSAYLNANQQGGQQIGNQVASNLTDKYNTTKSGIDTSAGAANQSIQSGYIPENTQLIQQVAANPTSAAADAGQLAAFQGQLNDIYSGPTSWADMGTQQGNVQTAQQYGNLLNTPGGNNVLTQDVEQKLNPGQTSQGINALDTLLFQGNPGAIGAAQTATQPYSTLNDYLNATNTGILGNISTGQAAAQQTSQDALNAFTGNTGTLTNLNAQIGSETTAAQAAAQAQANQQTQLLSDIQNLYGGVAQQTAPTTINTFGAGQSTPWANTTNYKVGQLSPQDLAAMGISQDQWNALQGSMTQAGTSTQGTGGHNFAAMSPTTEVALQNYLSGTQANPGGINAANVANQGEYAQMSAIQQLLGSKNPQGNAINPEMANLAGTAPTGSTNFDYAKALADSQNAAQQEQAAANQMTGALTSGADLAHAQGQHGGFMSNFGQLGQIASLANPFTLPVALATNQEKGLTPNTFLGGNPLVNPAAYLAQTSVKDAQKGKLAHGGEVENYLDKKDKKHG